MGGDSYDRDVGSSSSSGHFYDGGTSSEESKHIMNRYRMATEMNPFNRIIKSKSNYIIFTGLDVTGSNIEFARIFYDKLPMFWGQIVQQGYMPEANIGLSAIGDATCDRAPLQVAEIASAKALDDWIARLYLEGKGGGQMTESYELWAYYYARKAIIDAGLSFAFLLVDEAPYPSVKADLVEAVIGDHLTANIPSDQIFVELNQKLGGNLFVIKNPYCGQIGYKSNLITDTWTKMLGQNGGTLVLLNEEKSIVDVILGIIALRTGARTLEQYQEDMRNRDQTEERIKNVTKSITGITEQRSSANVIEATLPNTANDGDHQSDSHRL